MNKLVLPVVLVLMIGLIVFVSATMTNSVPINEGNYDIELTISKGWNLILATPIMGAFEGDDYPDDTIDSNSEVKRENIKAVYYYLRGQNKYLQMYPNAQEFSDYSKLLAQEDRAYVMFSSVWVYSDKSGVLKYSRVDVPSYNQVALEDGWNFLTITPEMTIDINNVGPEEEAKYTLNAMEGTCNILKSYGWNNQEISGGGNWDVVDMDFTFDKSLAGMGLLIKVSSDCSLGTPSGGNIPVVPNLP